MLIKTIDLAVYCLDSILRLYSLTFVIHYEEETIYRCL